MMLKTSPRKGMILSFESRLLQKQKMNALSLDLVDDSLTEADRLKIKWPYGI